MAIMNSHFDDPNSHAQFHESQEDFHDSSSLPHEDGMSTVVDQNPFAGVLNGIYVHFNPEAGPAKTAVAVVGGEVVNVPLLQPIPDFHVSSSSSHGTATNDPYESGGSFCSASVALCATPQRLRTTMACSIEDDFPLSQMPLETLQARLQAMVDEPDDSSFPEPVAKRLKLLPAVPVMQASNTTLPQCVLDSVSRNASFDRYSVLDFDSNVHCLPDRVIKHLRHGGIEEDLPEWLGASAMAKLNTLNSKVKESLFHLYPLMPAFWANPERFIDGMLNVYQQSCKLVPEGPLCTEVPVVVVSGCTGTGCPLEIIHNGLQMANTKQHKYKFKIVKVLSYEINPMAINMAKAITMGYPCLVEEMGDVQGMHEQVQLLLGPFSSSCKVIAIAGTECTNTSIANANQPLPEQGTSLLHAEHGRTFWHWYNGCHALVEMFGKGSVVHMHEFPRCSKEEDNTTVWQTMGLFRCSTDAADWGHAKRFRVWHTSPYLHKVKTTHIEVIKPKFTDKGSQLTDPDGWNWSPGAASTILNTPPVVLRRYWPLLVEKAARKGISTCSDFERMTLDSLQIQKGNEKKYAGVFFFLNNLGMTETRLKNVMSMYPCLKSVDAVTGEYLPISHAGSTKCGTKQFCNHCHEAMRILGGAWHYHCGLEVFLRVFESALQNWVADTETSKWHHWVRHKHFCGVDCKQKPSWSR